MDLETRLRGTIRDVPDFPKKGILFKDITPLLSDAGLFDSTIEALARPYIQSGVQAVAAVESRGFIFGACLAGRLRAGFIPIRKPGKLPYKTVRQSYSLEYGTDSLEMHVDAVASGARVLIVDDLLATGGTAAAAAQLVRTQGGEIVGATFVIELEFLKGRERLDGLSVRSLVRY